MSELKWDDRIKALTVYMGISLPTYGGWIRDGVYQVRYESMIDDRVTEFTRIQHYLEGLGLEPPSGGEMAEMSMVPHKLSFRRGRYGDWRDTFTSGHVEWADKYLGHVIRDWGYT
jgi:hypothetical protein